MDIQALISNLTNPTLLYFLLGVIAVKLKSDLEIPESSSRFISLYLLFAIGFRGGQELAHSAFNIEIMFALLFGVFLAIIVPFYSFFVLRYKLNVYDSAAVAASYGSVSAVTFITATSFLEVQGYNFSGYMVAVMALMESPAIIVGSVLVRRFGKEDTDSNEPVVRLRTVVAHSFISGSVLMILGSLVIGLIADTKQAEGIKPFTNDIFKGFLAIFLLEMGMIAARRFEAFKRAGWFLTLFAILIPAINGIVVAYVSQFITNDIGNRLIFSILAASASYIAVPAAMRITVPQADPGLYIPMALGVTFPFNITFGIPLYMSIIQLTS